MKDSVIDQKSTKCWFQIYIMNLCQSRNLASNGRQISIVFDNFVEFWRLIEAKPLDRPRFIIYFWNRHLVLFGLITKSFIYPLEFLKINVFLWGKY